MDVPSLGPSVPRRGNAISRAIGRVGLSAAGWRFEGDVPDERKFVIIVVPHTSNWDFILGVEALFSLGFRVSFLGKHTLFKWPIGIFMRWMGGIAVERTVRKDRVADTIAAFDSADKLILAVAPEGTRKRVAEWKTGFYHVAHGAHVPIVPVAFDYGRKVVRFYPPFWTTGDAGADMPRIKDLYRGVVARNSDNFQLE
ncbi:MAG: lysophospholipid acyltransferase family protein [Gemmatimonadaceae bacterium]